MRAIKFRGKSKDKQLWEYGNLLHKRRTNSKATEIYESYYIQRVNFHLELEVIPETIGQFTGFYDKNGKEIYEGDILRYCEKNKQIYIVKYGSYNRNADLKSTAPQYIGATFFLDGTGIGMYKKEDYEVINPIYTYNGHAFLYPVSGDFPSTFERYKELWGLEIIGNIYENPELLEK